MVNGPEDPSRMDVGAVEWDAIDWAATEGEYGGYGKGSSRRRRTGLGQGPEAAEDVAAVPVEHAGQRAAGDPAQCWPHDAGVDGEVALTSRQDGGGGARAPQHPDLAAPAGQAGVHPEGRCRTKQRPLGIPVIMDRCHQGRVRNALEPEWL